MTPFPAFIRPVIFLSVFISLFTTGCLRETFGIHGSGSAVNETRHPGTFSGVDLSLDANVILHADSVCRVEIRGQQNVLNVLTTDIRAGRLCIGSSRNVLSHSGLTIDVYAPYYSFAGISGSGTISNVDGWNTADLEAKVSGTGTVTLYGVNATHAGVTISGSGTVRLNGSCQSFEGKISGSGDIHAFGMPGTTGDVRVSGSGDVELDVSQSLDVQISGSGDVYYRNNPAVNANISGSGRLIHVQ